MTKSHTAAEIQSGNDNMRPCRGIEPLYPDALPALSSSKGFSTLDGKSRSWKFGLAARNKNLDSSHRHN